MTQSSSNAASERNGTVNAQVIGLSELSQPSNTAVPLAPAQASDLSEHDGNPLRHVKTRVTVCVGSVVLSVGELLQARQDQVLRLDSAVQDPVDLLIEGKVVARGQLVAMDDHFAVRITQLSPALKA